MSELVSTGVEGLDSILTGGITQRSTVLVSGNPGTGKSIFGIQYLHHGVSEHGERGVYVSFEEDEADIRGAAESVGFEGFDEMVDDGDIVILDKREMLRETDFSTAVDRLLDTVEDGDFDRLVLDSLS
ncbi:circadian regulator CirA, partial [Halorubrum sp. E3]